MRDVISNYVKENSKRFWSFLKMMRHDQATSVAFWWVSEILNKHSSQTTPKIAATNHTTAQPIFIYRNITDNPNGVNNLLIDLLHLKLHAPDGIPNKSVIEALNLIVLKAFMFS